jgi:hypothetical protein
MTTALLCQQEEQMLTVQCTEGSKGKAQRKMILKQTLPEIK